MPTIQRTPVGKTRGSNGQQQQNQQAAPTRPKAPWHALCLALRGEVERAHREHIYRASVLPPGPPRVCLDTVAPPPYHTAMYLIRRTASELCRLNGWDEATELPPGSSASWVDTAIYPYWTGRGAAYEQEVALQWEWKCRQAVEDLERADGEAG